MTTDQTIDPLAEYDARLIRAQAILGQNVGTRSDDPLSAADDRLMAAQAMASLAGSSDNQGRASAMSFLLDRKRRQTDTIDKENRQVARTATDGRALAQRILQLHYELGGDSGKIRDQIAREGWDRSLITPDTLMAMDEARSAAVAAGDELAARAASETRGELLSMQDSRINRDMDHAEYVSRGIFPDKQSPMGISGAAYAIPGAPPSGYKDPELKKTLGDALTSGKASQIPFAGPAWDFVTHQLPAIVAAHKIQIGEGSTADYATLSEYQAGLIRDAITPKTTLNKTAEFVKDSASLGIELAAGGLLTAPREAAEKLVRNRAEKSIARAAVGAAASAAASLPGQGGRIAETAGSRMIPGVSGTDGGGVSVADAEGVAPAIAKGVLDTYIENLSERIGEVGKLLPGGKFVGRMRENLLNRLGIDPASKGAKVIDEIAKAGGYNGPLPEIGEEYFGGLLKWATGLQDSPNAIPMDDLPAFALSTLVPGGATLAAKGAYAMTQRGGGSAAAGPVSESTTAPQEPTNEEGQEEGRKEGLLSPEPATTPEAATPGADKPPAPADRVGMAYRSELKRMGYSENEIDGMDRAKALEIIRGQQRAFEGFVGAIEQAPETVGTPAAPENAAEGLGAESDARGDSVEERNVEAGGGVAGLPEGEGVGVDEPGNVRPVADRLETVVGDQGVEAGDQPGDVAVDNRNADAAIRERAKELVRGEPLRNLRGLLRSSGQNDQGPAWDIRDRAEMVYRKQLTESGYSQDDPIEPGTPTTVPERPETIKAQLDELKAGKRPAVLVTPGAKAAIPPKGMKALRTKAGRFIYDPARLTADEIQASVREDRIGEVLGYGIANKPAPGSEAGVVTVRDADGLEKRAVVTDAENMASVVAEAQKVTEPGDSVAIESPQKVLEGRAPGAQPDLNSTNKLIKPIVGKTGAKIVGYQWMSQMEEGMFRDRRVSDWSRKATSEPTGRDIVHVFWVETPDGNTSVMGVGAANKALGIPETRLRSIAEQEQRAQQIRKQQWDAAERRSIGKAPTSASEADAAYRKANDPNKMMWGTPSQHAAAAEDIFKRSSMMTKDGRFLRTGDKDQIAEYVARGWNVLADYPDLANRAPGAPYADGNSAPGAQKDAPGRESTPKDNPPLSYRTDAFNRVLKAIESGDPSDAVRTLIGAGHSRLDERQRAWLEDRLASRDKSAKVVNIATATDNPMASSVYQAKASKAAAWKRVQQLREEVRTLGPHAGQKRLELLKAESAHREAVRWEKKAREAFEARANEVGETAKKPAAQPVGKMKNSELRAELEAGGVEVPEGTKRKALVSGVEELRKMPKEEAAADSKQSSPVAIGTASEWNAELAKSPRGKQWLAFKQRQPGVMLAFRTGDFYEFFAEDAVAAHKAFGLTLTQRSSGVPMSGIPYSQLEQYLRKFIGAGFKVALVEPTDAAEAKAAAQPEPPSPSKQPSGRVVFGEVRSATEYGGRVKKAVAVLLTDSDGNMARRLDLVKDGSDWDIMEADKPTMVKVGSQFIRRKQTHSNLGTVIGDLRRAKEVAERVIRGELDPKARVEVQHGFEPDASFANAWRGSTPTEDTSLITDGTILVKADALKPKMAERLRASENTVYRSPVSKNATDSIWNDTIKKSVSPATLVGYAPDLNNDVAVFDLGGSVMALNAAKFKMIADSTGADAFRAESPKKALVLMKSGKPVAIIMPINLGDRAPVLSTDGQAVSEKIIAKADAVEKAARSRIAKRQIPRGRNVGAALSPQEVIDYGIIVAARATKFGIKSALMLRDTAKRMIENDYPEAREYLLDIIRVADSIVRKSYDETGRFSQSMLDSAIADVESRRTEIPPVSEVVSKARAETVGERTIGRPDLANPAEDEQARRVVDAVDQARKESGQPETRSDAQVVSEADKRISENYEAEKRSLLAKADSGQLLSDTDTVIAQKIVSEAAFKAVSEGDENAMLQAITLADAYRETGTQAARAFRQRRDRFKSPARRHAEYVGELIATPSQSGRRTLASINEQIRKADTPKEADALRAKKADVLKREAETAKKIQQRLRAMGIEPSSINDETIADPKRAAAIARAISTAKSSGYDMATEYWINAILSGPQTHAANTIGNFAYGAWRTFCERAIEAGLADAARSFGADFKAGAPTLGEFKAIFESLGPALTRASQNFVRAFRDETPVLEEQVRMAGGETPGGSGSKLELPETRAAIPGKTGRAVRTPTRSLLAADEFFKGLWGTMDAYARGYRRAVEVEGLRGEDAMRRAGEHAMDLSSPAWEEALSYAEDVSFQSDPGAIVKQVLALRNRAPFLRYIIPFVTTPTNILKAGLERTPLVSLRSLAKLANTGAVKLGYGKEGWTYNRTNITPELTKNIIGWGTLLALNSLAGGGDDDELPFITGSTPRDRGRRDAMYRTVPPMSIRIGDRWFSYARIEPFATAIATSVDAIDAMNKAQSGDEYMSAFGAALASTTRQIDDKSFLQGIADIMDAVKNEDGNGSKALQYGANFASSWVPSIIKQALRSADQNVRDTTVKTTKDRGTIEAVAMTTAYRAIPQIASPRVDLWGREISARNWESGVPGTDFVYRLLSPIRTQDLDSASTLDLLLLRYNNDPKNAESMWFPAPPSPTFTRKERGKNVTYTMSEQEYHDFLVASGKRAAERLSKARLNYVEPGPRDIENIRNAIEDARKQERERFIRQEKGTRSGTPLR